jgi:hypothetical protein
MAARKLLGMLAPSSDTMLRPVLHGRRNPARQTGFRKWEETRR